MINYRICKQFLVEGQVRLLHCVKVAKWLNVFISKSKLSVFDIIFVTVTFLKTIKAVNISDDIYIYIFRNIIRVEKNRVRVFRYNSLYINIRNENKILSNKRNV